MLKLESVCARHLQNVYLTLKAGECITVTGGSGSGKTLLLRIIADLEPFTGILRLDDRSHVDFHPWEWRRRVGMLPASSQWWFDTVALHFQDLPNGWLTQVGFDPSVMQWSVNRLSSGERQRLALLRLLANRPQVLLLDEPTANLDQDLTIAVEQLLAAYRRETGAAMIWVTHDGHQIRRVAERCMTIRGNTLCQQGAP